MCLILRTKAIIVKFVRFMHCMNMNKRLLIVLALAVVLASGCDWIRAKLDMPTSEDIARKKEMIAQKEAEKVVLAWFKSSVLMPKYLAFGNTSLYYLWAQEAKAEGKKRKRGRRQHGKDIKQDT